MMVTDILWLGTIGSSTCSTEHFFLITFLFPVQIHRDAESDDSDDTDDESKDQSAHVQNAEQTDHEEPEERDETEQDEEPEEGHEDPSEQRDEHGTLLNFFFHPCVLLLCNR